MKVFRQAWMILALVAMIITSAVASGPKSAGTRADDEHSPLAIGWTKAKVEKAQAGLLQGLQSNCAGVVESAIFQIVKIKIDLRESDLAGFQKQISRLIVEGETPEVRYKAYIAHFFLDNPNLLFNSSHLPELQRLSDENRDHFFAILTEEVKQYMLKL